MGPTISLNMTGSSSYLSKEEQDTVQERLHTLADQFSLEEPHVHLSIKEQHQSKRGDRKYQASVRIVSNLGEFVASEESYGVMRTVIETLSLMEEQVRKTGEKKRYQQRRHLTGEEN